MSLRRNDASTTSPAIVSKREASAISSRATSPSTSVLNQSPVLQISLLHHQHDLNRVIPPRMTLFPELSRLELHFLDIMLHKGISVDKYLIGPSFRDRHLQSFVDHLNAEMPHVKDAFIACASHLTDNESLQQVAQGQSIGYRRAAAAIASLRISNIHSDTDLSMMLIMGVAISTFTLHHSSCLPICKYILGLVKCMYEKDQSLLERLSGDGAAFFLCLLGTEIEECVISCQVPTIRINPGTFDQLIDRFAGVSAPIFTHFYDICEVARQFQSMRSEERPCLDAALEERRCSLRAILEECGLTVSETHLAESFTPHEVMTMTVQHKVLRLSALIILHRLRYPYGTEDRVSLAMANSILRDLDTIMELTGRAVPFADLPHLVACFELRDHAERRDALEKSQRLINFSQYCRTEQQASLVAFWAARDRAGRRDLYWTDIDSCIT
ncbi:hypothetical protein LLEC1_05386 [Akanthomyces lecanii]|uniref:Uncharacterized protein n=1 Tax=Cordyceps confragosa TaxID=2714763 RepID=A0A179IEZ3_CORDF|nr:hypothetical protein LLEC1_05386 [Akanthomyces lecanii]